MVENELIPLGRLGQPFSGKVEKFCRLLEQFRLLTYGQLISRAVSELEQPAVASQVHQRLRHLIVDEYQDVNPAQERLVRLLTGPDTELCVAGDDADPDWGSRNQRTFEQVKPLLDAWAQYDNAVNGRAPLLVSSEGREEDKG